MKHELKCDEPWFSDIKRGEKCFDVRRNDRGGYLVGDVLRLWSNRTPGEFIDVAVNYVLQGGQYGVEPGYVVLGIHVLTTQGGRGG